MEKLFSTTSINFIQMASNQILKSCSNELDQIDISSLFKTNNNKMISFPLNQLANKDENEFILEYVLALKI